MNNTFNVKRFILLFKKYSIEHAKANLLSLLVLMGLLFLLLGYYSYSSHGHLDKNAQGVSFIFFMLVGGSIYTSISFSALGDKKKAIPFLILPASHFEKYLVSWLYTYIIFQVVFLGAFYLVDIIVIHLGVKPVAEWEGAINIFVPQEKGSMVFLVYTVFNGLTLWGAVFFEKLHFIKTSIIFFVCLAVLILFNNQLLNMLIVTKATLISGIPFQELDLNDNINFWRITPDQSWILCGKDIILFTAILLWTSAFYRLKEKEV